jgi:hypothetical protein
MQRLMVVMSGKGSARAEENDIDMRQGK